MIQKIELIPQEKRVYLDESGINQYLHRQKDKKFLSPMCFEGTCDTDRFNVCLKQEWLPNLTPGQVLILDNASFHKSIATRNLVEPYGCEIMFLSPHSPDLNPIEKYWANMKTKIRELLPTSATLSEAFDAAILSMSI